MDGMHGWVFFFCQTGFRPGARDAVREGLSSPAARSWGFTGEARD